jgi:hypothetical protein
MIALSFLRAVFDSIEKRFRTEQAKAEALSSGFVL